MSCLKLFLWVSGWLYCFSLNTSMTYAQDQAASYIDPDIEINRIIVNGGTLSKPGNDFYRLFYRQWQWPEVSGQFTITIKEIPFRGTSTQIIVMLNELKIFQSFLQPRYELVKQLVDAAIAITTRQIYQYNEILKQLGGDDLEGTGIY